MAISLDDLSIGDVVISHVRDGKARLHEVVELRWLGGVNDMVLCRPHGSGDTLLEEVYVIDILFRCVPVGKGVLAELGLTA